MVPANSTCNDASDGWCQAKSMFECTLEKKGIKSHGEDVKRETARPDTRRRDF